MSITDRIRIAKGDITKLKVDAIVNAANSSLLGGGGVDGAIHRAAGPKLLAECKTLNGCPTGEAKITGGYKLPSEYVIHTVGPVWHGGNRNERELLANCYKNSLRLADTKKINSVAFPSISTGAYRFPIDQAAEIALNETIRYLKNHDLPGQVTFVCFSDSDYQSYKAIFSRLTDN